MKITYTLPVEIWNHAVRALRRGRPLAGRNCRIAVSPWGSVVEYVPPSGWKHPWFTTPGWNAESGKWEVTIEPGIVHAADPLAAVATIDPLTGEIREETPLLERPKIPVQGWRAIGNDEGEENPPKFFEALGVRRNSPPPAETGAGLSITSSLADAAPRRFLRAVDFVVAVARASLVGRITIVDASGISGQVVDYAVGLDASRVLEIGTRARVRQETKFARPRLPTLEERLLGLYADPTEDAELISTLYLLSPEDAPTGEPDATWSPYVAHNLFWNLGHAPQNEPPKNAPPPIRLFTGLLFGVGDALGNQILSGINEFGERVENAVNNVSQAGRFWTV